MSAYAAGPEHVARARISELEERKGLHENCGAPPLTIAEQSHLRGLRTLFPKVLPPPDRYDNLTEWQFPGLAELLASESASDLRPETHA